MCQATKLPQALTGVGFSLQVRRDQQRSFALGIQWIVVRTLGTVLYKEAKHSCVVCSLHKSRGQAQEPPSRRLCHPREGCHSLRVH